MSEAGACTLVGGNIPMPVTIALSSFRRNFTFLILLSLQKAIMLIGPDQCMFKLINEGLGLQW